ncbi:hypothetical protein [uncultured Corynebacterium sp.]|uniref:hypothetical protein n=1 Tax=uncultured Corynebacterium sp. TaxID=159447 RepID=UPI0025F40EDC|nr:hypothetical protein [uncultured Corynebacterium sp.]
MEQPAYIVILVEPDRDSTGALAPGERGVAAEAIERLGRPEQTSPVIDAVLGAVRGSFPQAQLAGDRAIAIDCAEDGLEDLLGAVAGGIVKFGLQMTVQPGYNALAFGDDDPRYLTRTIDHEVPFASPIGIGEILQRLRIVQQELDAQAGPGQGMADFVIVADATLTGEHYIQSFYDGVEQGFTLEVRLGDGTQHFQIARVTLEAAVAVFRAWMRGERDFVDSKWKKLDFEV